MFEQEPFTTNPTDGSDTKHGDHSGPFPAFRQPGVCLIASPIEFQAPRHPQPLSSTEDFVRLLKIIIKLNWR